MNDQTFYQLQAFDLRRLLKGVEDDPILGPQLRARLEAAEKKIKEFQQQSDSLLPNEPVHLPRAAIFFRGNGVKDSEGIRPSLAGEALIQYEKMFVEQAIHDERQAARAVGRKRRPRGSAIPGLLFTGTPRGSFGLEFAAEPTNDSTSLQVHAESLRHIAEALTRVAESDENSFDEAIKAVPSRVIAPLKKFWSVLAEHDAELRLAFQDGPSKSIGLESVKTAALRLEREVSQETIRVSGIFRGVTYDSGHFDITTATGDLISGTVADNLSESDIEALHMLTNQPCVAQLQRTTVSKIAGPATHIYVLLSAMPPEDLEPKRPLRHLELD